MKRVPQREVLDGDTENPDAVLESLGDLRMVNRWFGGVRITAYLLRRAMKDFHLRSASVLDVAAADGYVITSAAERLRSEGLHIKPVCLDRREIGREAHCCERVVVGDALDLAYPPGSFDFVSCGLFVHHLSPTQVVAFVNGALVVARHAVLINDLRRSSIHLALVYAGTPLFRSYISRFDSVASVKQAYTPAELRELMLKTDAARFEICISYLYRMGAIIYKQ